MYRSKPGAEGVQFMGAIFLIAGVFLILYAIVLSSNWSDPFAEFLALAGLVSMGSGLTLLGHPLL